LAIPLHSVHTFFLYIKKAAVLAAAFGIHWYRVFATLMKNQKASVHVSNGDGHLYKWRRVGWWHSSCFDSDLFCYCCQLV